MCNIFFNLVNFSPFFLLAFPSFPYSLLILSIHQSIFIFFNKKLYCYPGRNGSTLCSDQSTCCTHWDLQRLRAGSLGQLSGTTGEDSGQCELPPSQASQISPVPPHFLNSAYGRNSKCSQSDQSHLYTFVYYIINRLINFVSSAYIFVDAAVYFLVFYICFCALH